MATSQYKTDLSVSPASYQMSHTARETLAFDAGEAIASAEVALVDRHTRNDAGTVEAAVIVGTTVEVTISALTFGNVYELLVTFERADGERWSRTLVIECVA